MLFLHETHKVKGKLEDEFEAAIRDGWMQRLAEGDEARLLWYANHAHGSGASYQVVTITGVADGAWEGLARRIQSGDLQKLARELDALRHDVEGKLLLPVYWSPLQSVDFADVPTDGREHELTLFMEDTGWPDVALDEYIRFWDEDYYQVMGKGPRTPLLDIQACFQVAHGTGTRLNDTAEANAIKSVLGTSVPVVSTKAFTGHTLGAAAALELAFSACAIEEGWIPPALGAGAVDPEIDIHVPTSRTAGSFRRVMSNSFAFGGNNVSLLVGAP